MVPLEVTHTALTTPAVLARMFHRGSNNSLSPFKAMVQLLLTFFESTYRCAWSRVRVCVCVCEREREREREREGDYACGVPRA
jgi:inosine-uridine nucleoside N-ribohydrolase